VAASNRLERLEQEVRSLKRNPAIRAGDFVKSIPRRCKLGLYLVGGLGGFVYLIEDFIRWVHGR